MAATERTPTLLYDGDCGFCTAAVEWITAHGRLRPSDVVRPWERDDVERFGVTAEQAGREIHYLTPTGAVLGGADAVFGWWRHCGLPWAGLAVALSLPGLRQLSRVGYRLIARNRYRLPGSTAACRAPIAAAPDAGASTAGPRFASHAVITIDD